MGIYGSGLFVNIIACLEDGEFLVELSCTVELYIIKKNTHTKRN
jgi:hypothetical protein